MKIFRKIAWILLISFIVIQFFPTMENKSDLVPATDLIKSHEVPSQVATLIHNACYDCHSNNTDYPWYNHIQPSAWFLEGHIEEGKKHLNFNEFDTYSRKKQKKKLEHIRHMVDKDKMPLTSYKLIHWDADLSKNERKKITDWVEEELKNYN